MSDRRWVFFDIDQTLCDFAVTRERALRRSLAALRVAVGNDADRLTVADLQRVRDAIADCSAADRSMEEIRQQSFQEVLRGLGLSGAELKEATDDVTEQYFEARFSNPVLYDDVNAALGELAATFELGAISNGNSYPERLGLHTRFAAVVLAQDVGARKPDRAIFEAALEVAGATAAETVMVGDSLHEDISGARHAGWRAIWLDRRGDQVKPPDVARVTSLRDLPAVLADM